jgi:putative transposase
VISELRGTRKYHSIAFLCAAFDYTRQAWYNHLRNVELHLLEEHVVLEKIIEIRKVLPKQDA